MANTHYFDNKLSRRYIELCSLYDITASVVFKGSAAYKSNDLARRFLGEVFMETGFHKKAVSMWALFQSNIDHDFIRIIMSNRTAPTVEIERIQIDSATPEQLATALYSAMENFYNNFYFGTYINKETGQRISYEKDIYSISYKGRFSSRFNTFLDEYRQIYLNEFHNNTTMWSAITDFDPKYSKIAAMNPRWTKTGWDIVGDFPKKTKVTLPSGKLANVILDSKSNRYLIIDTQEIQLAHQRKPRVTVETENNKEEEEEEIVEEQKPKKDTSSIVRISVPTRTVQVGKSFRDMVTEKSD